MKLKKPASILHKLDFLVGRWHTEGEIIKTASKPSIPISGMDSYEWINNGFFLLHRADVFMGAQRTEVIELIGYDPISRQLFMESFDNHGEKMLMHAEVKKAGVVKILSPGMRSILSADNKVKRMKAEWELLAKDGSWKPWMHLTFRK